VKVLTVRLPDQLFEEISANAKAKNVSKSEIVRERIMRSLDSNKRVKRSLWDQMEDLVIDSDFLPRDLSSNKNHLTSYEIFH
jgi:metal-responsive CopG/Arc/MetJ family transcriptional regulator